MLVQAGANLDQPDIVRCAQLIFHSHVLYTVLCWFCSPPAVQSQRTPLYVAARNGHVEVVRVLVQAGANLDQADNVRCAPLTSYSHEAISLPSSGSVTLLVMFFT